jgi:hypothetical protein
MKSETSKLIVTKFGITMKVEWKVSIVIPDI